MFAFFIIMVIISAITTGYLICYIQYSKKINYESPFETIQKSLIGAITGTIKGTVKMTKDFEDSVNCNNMTEIELNDMYENDKRSAINIMDSFDKKRLKNYRKILFYKNFEERK